MRQILVFILLAIGASGCVKHWYFVNPEADAKQFGQDQYACGQDATSNNMVVQFNQAGGYAGPQTRVDSAIFRSCMQARGYNAVKLPASETPPPHHYYSEIEH